MVVDNQFEKYDAPSRKLLQAFENPWSVMSPRLFETVRWEIRTNKHSPSVQHQILDLILGDWTKLRDAQLDAGSTRWALPDAVIEAWAAYGSTFSRMLIPINPNLPGRSLHPTIVERIFEEARKDQLLHIELDGESTEGFGVLLLGRYFESNPTVTPELQEAFTGLFADRDNPPSVLTLEAAAELPGLVVPPHALVSSAMLLPQGIQHLRRVRDECDAETWDALCPTWRGTIEELKEACVLVGEGSQKPARSWGEAHGNPNGIRRPLPRSPRRHQ